MHNSIAIDVLRDVCNQWPIEIVSTRPDILLAGSPERTEYRIVVENNDHKLFIAEKISPEKISTKQNIINVLAFLENKKLEKIHPYIKSKTGKFFIDYHDDIWQLVPYVTGVELERPEYVNDGWRGIAMADFLCKLEKSSSGIERVTDAPFFSIISFILDFKDRLAQNDPDVFNYILELIEYLENNLFPLVDDLPIGFCHGDIHPLNIIWSENSIESVIDWEFHGFKSRIYDISNLIGCLGMEEPNSLLKPMLLNIISFLRDRNYFNELEGKLLVDYIIAVRFAWLSDWLKRNDQEMVKLELAFMYLLFDNKTKLEQKWVI